MEDRELIALYVARDERAIAETATAYGRLCHRIAENILGDPHEAEECVNDTYLGLWQTIPPERPLCFRAFIAKIARNRAIGRLQYKTAARRRPAALLSLSELEEVLPDDGGFEEMEDREVGRMISDFLRGEREDVRNIFIRKYWFFDSIATLSEAYGYSGAKIKSLLFQTRKRLRAYLTEKGVAL